MNVGLRRPMTIKEFLAWEERQALRHEFDGFQPHAMTGGTAAHAGIQANLTAAVHARLRGTKCRLFGSELKVRLAHSVRYPDALMVRTPVEPTANWVTDPVVVFEILSESTTHEDIVVKNAEYAAAPSILFYVVVEQTRLGALVVSRRNGQWAAETIAGANAILQLPEIGIEIPFSELYSDVDVVADPSPDYPP